MKRIIIGFAVFYHIFSGMFALPDYHQPHSAGIFAANHAMAADVAPSPGSMTIRYDLFSISRCIVGFVLLWLLFYKLVYPFLLKYYPPDYSESLFWSMFFLYGIAWGSINLYTVFRIGFYYSLTKWVFVFLGAIWLIWFMVILFRKDSTDYY